MGGSREVNGHVSFCEHGKERGQGQVFSVVRAGKAKQEEFLL